MAVNYGDSAAAYRKRVGEFLEAYEQLLAINTEYVAMGVGAGVVAGDFADITVVQFTNMVAAAQAVMVTIDTNKTPLYIGSDGTQR